MKKRDLAPDQLFFSRTDLKGKILDANRIFYEINRYKREELLNKPHNLIRHPGNPHLIYEIMWKRIQNGKPFFFYIKNRTKDKHYYWVGTLILPLYSSSDTITGYLSIRIAPTADYFDIFEDFYEKLSNIEQNEPHRAKEFFENFYKELGFEDLDAFMNALLEEEIATKERYFHIELNRDEFDNQTFYDFYIYAKMVEIQYSLIYKQIRSIIDFTNYLQTGFKKIYETSESLSLIALNSSVQSNKLGSQGATFFVVSSAIKKNSELINAIISQTEAESKSTIATITQLRLRLNLTRLLSFATIYFIAEYNRSNERSTSIHKRSLEDIFLTLSHTSNELKSYLLNYLGNIQNLEEKHIATIKKTLSDLNYIYLNGLIESAKLENNIFTIIFKQIQELVESTFSILDTIRPKLSRQKKEAEQMLQNIEFVLESLAQLNNLPIEKEEEAR